MGKKRLASAGSPGWYSSWATDGPAICWGLLPSLLVCASHTHSQGNMPRITAAVGVTASTVALYIRRLGIIPTTTLVNQLLQVGVCRSVCVYPLLGQTCARPAPVGAVYAVVYMRFGPRIHRRKHNALAQPRPPSVRISTATATATATTPSPTHITLHETACVGPVIGTLHLAPCDMAQQRWRVVAPLWLGALHPDPVIVTGSFQAEWPVLGRLQTPVWPCLCVCAFLYVCVCVVRSM